MRLDDDMQRVVREQSLGFVATVCPDGTANVSPKGTLTVWDDEHLAFLHIHSPRTVANLATNPSVEINVVDPLVRKGYRFKGEAEVLTDGELHDAVLERYARRAWDGPVAGASGRALARRRGGAGRLPRLRRRRQRGGRRAALARPPPRSGGGSVGRDL